MWSKLQSDMGLAAQQQLGNWAQNLMMSLYSKIITGEDFAKTAGFHERAQYYLPRADLLPCHFAHTPGELCQGWQDMYDGWPFTFVERDLEALNQLNRVYGNDKKMSDKPGATMLETFTGLFRKLHFQDLPFFYFQNHSHHVFSEDWFQRFRDPWHRWCKFFVSNCENIEEVQRYVNVYTYNSA